MVRDHGHVIALEQLVLAGHDTSRPHRRKGTHPTRPGRTRGSRATCALQHPTSDAVNDDVVIDLAKYDRAATGRNTLT